RRLIEGLRSPDRALVPAADAVRLLGLRMPADAFPVLQELLARPPDEETRIEAIHHLGAHPPSRDALIAVLQDEEETPEAREAALGALHANVPQSLPEIVTPVLRDEGATDRLKVRAMKAVQWHRLSSAQEARMEGLEEFDAAVRAMAEESRSEEVRECAREYLGTVKSAEPPGS
ncbi:MAG TPA: HEAT repeat domain-containing protein, partial [Thermoanaerobaculia bacterium]|nr:HEAT repeat domain-containing protein [Thermoanaerobaculia bacterium]